MKSNNFFLISLIVSITISCQQKANELSKQEPEIPQIQTNDINLIKKYKKPFADYIFARQNLILNENLTESYISDFIDLANLLKDDILLNKARNMLMKYETENQYTNLPLKEAIYFKLVHQQSHQALTHGLNQTEKDILASLDTVKLILKKNNSELKTINSHMNLIDQILIAEKYINKIIQTIETHQIYPEFKIKVLTELKTQSSIELQKPRSLYEKLNKSQNLSESISNLKSYINENNVQLTPVDQISLQQAEELSQLIDGINDSKTALQSLAMAWSMLTNEERILNFKEANSKLYDFFEKKSEQEIQCLIKNTCSGFFKKLILKFGVYPAIEDYGIDNIKKTLTDNSLAKVNLNVQTQAAQTILNLDESLSLQINTQVQINLTELNQFKLEFVQTVADGLEQRLNQNMISLFSLNKPFDFQREFTHSTNQAQLVTQSNEFIQFTLIEKMLQFMNLGETSQKMSFIDSIKETLQKAEPRFYIQNNKATDTKLNIRDQAASIIFYSKMIDLLSDWKTTPFDQGISKYRAQDFITKFKSPELNRLLFQKSELIGMSLSLAGQTLKQIETDQSVIYLLDSNNQKVSIKDYLNNTVEFKNTPLVHAAASDIKNGQILDYTQLQDLCYLIKAYSHYYFAIENIELSNSESLKNPELLNQIIQSRKQMKLVILTLSNFISNQLINQEKTLNSIINFQNQEKTLAHQSTDYALAINALMIAYQVTNIDIYKMSALELYYKLNHQFFSAEGKFYKKTATSSSSNPKVNQDYLVKMFVLLYPLRSVLDLPSQMQFDRIFENWMLQL